jgi:hypothetical protein
MVGEGKTGEASTVAIVTGGRAVGVACTPERLHARLAMRMKAIMKMDGLF